MTSKWPVVRLSKVVTIQGGYAFKSNEYVDSGHYLIRIANVIDDQVIQTDEKYVDLESDPKLMRFALAEGDLLMTLTGNIGRTAIVNSAILPAALNQRVARIHADLDKTSNRYLQYLFSSEEFIRHILGKGHGAAQQNVSTKDLETFEFPLPPLDEQKRIVAKLDNAMELVSQSEVILDQTLNKQNELEIAEFISEFLSLRSEFESTTIGDLFKTGSGSTPLKSRRDYYDDGEIPWLLSGEVAQRDITEAKNFITEKALAETAVKFVPPNSVLVAMYGATAGEVGLLRFECTTNQAVCAIHPHPDYLPRFVYYSLLSMQNYLVSQAAGNAQPNVSQAKIKQLPFPKVPLRRQEEAVQRLDNVVNMRNELDALQKNKKSAVTDLKNSLLSAAFAGEL